MSQLRLLTLLTATALAGTALTSVAHAEVIIRMAPVHTDAMVENYNPYNLSGPHSYVRQCLAPGPRLPGAGEIL